MPRESGARRLSWPRPRPVQASGDLIRALTHDIGRSEHWPIRAQRPPIYWTGRNAPSRRLTASRASRAGSIAWEANLTGDIRLIGSFDGALAKSGLTNHFGGMLKSFDLCLPNKSTSVPFGPDWLHKIKYNGNRLRLERDGDRMRRVFECAAKNANSGVRTGRRRRGLGFPPT
jgi:hypothetical protein